MPGYQILVLDTRMLGWRHGDFGECSLSGFAYGRECVDYLLDMCAAFG